MTIDKDMGTSELAAASEDEKAESESANLFIYWLQIIKIQSEARGSDTEFFCAMLLIILSDLEWERCDSKIAISCIF